MSQRRFKPETKPGWFSDISWTKVLQYLGIALMLFWLWGWNASLSHRLERLEREVFRGTTK